MKDYFNGNIKRPKELLIELWLFAILLCCSAIFFLITALFYDNSDFNTRVMLIIFSIIWFVFSIGYPIATIYVVKNRKKYPRLAKLLVKTDRFT